MNLAGFSRARLTSFVKSEAELSRDKLNEFDRRLIRPDLTQFDFNRAKRVVKRGGKLNPQVPFAVSTNYFCGHVVGFAFIDDRAHFVVQES